MSGPVRATAEPAAAADLAETAALRHRVFVAEQGVPAEVEQDAADAVAVHVLSRADDGRVVATGRLVARDGVAVIGRMAADAAARGRGHGAAVLDELHWQATLRGLAVAELHAQVTARRFYDRAGYTAVGGEYPEAGIVHVTMRRPLPELRRDGARLALIGPDGVLAEVAPGPDGTPHVVSATARAREEGLDRRLLALAREPGRDTPVRPSA